MVKDQGNACLAADVVVFSVLYFIVMTAFTEKIACGYCLRCLKHTLCNRRVDPQGTSSSDDKALQMEIS